jgi:ABC-type antimicrobial peptide transport system permease subunit
MFDVKVIEGNHYFLIPGSGKLAITQEKARLLFGNESPIGKRINSSQEICALVTGFPKHSNYDFDFIGAFEGYVLDLTRNWNTSGANIVIALHPSTDIIAFEKKLFEHEVSKEQSGISKMKLTSLTKLRYTDPDIVREVKFQYIFIFALAGLLVVLCSLFNYLTLFVSRFRVRQKELALRMVFGASEGSLLTMLSVEFLLTMFFAIALGCELTYLLHKLFLNLSAIQMKLSVIYWEILIYLGGVLLIFMLLFRLMLFIFRRRSLNQSIRQSNKQLFRKVSVIMQLVISIGFAFCTVTILRQIYFLYQSETLGFSIKNSGSLTTFDSDLLASHLKQIPEITEVVDAAGSPILFPMGPRSIQSVETWNEKSADAESFNIEKINVSPEYIAFYDFRLVEGEMLTEADPNTMVLVNESAVKAFGWHEPVGKLFGDRYRVKGVIKNIYPFALTVQAIPLFLQKRDLEAVTDLPKGARRANSVLFKYQEGMWQSCKEKIEQLKEEHVIRGIYNTEEIYDNYLKSEKALIKLLSAISVVCILICVFGFVCLVSLTCEERRKSIAIRKINGATIGDIVSIFAKEYSLLLMIGAVIAISTSFFIMQRWLEQYVKQTSIPAWVYLSILFVMALLIVLCVGWQVYRTSIENPAEVVKNE